MPRAQDSSLFVAVIIFVGLFIISTALAVVFYLKITDLQKTVMDTDKRIEELASAKEVRAIGTTVGTKIPRKTVLATLLARYDELTAMILGNVPEETSAEAKLEMARQEKKQIFSEMTDIVGRDVNSTGLIRAIELANEKLGESQSQQASLTEELNEVQRMLDEQNKAQIEKEQEISATIKRLQSDSNSATSSYEALKAAMQQSSDQQVASVTAKLDEADQNLKNSQQELLATQAKLKTAESRINALQEQVEAITPKPENMSAALKPAGNIISVDDGAQTVIINLGSDDHVYRGLTFAVYDKGQPMPRDGKGKANIEVFDIRTNVSVARITQSDKRSPVMAGDVIANLIWNAHARREFVAAGEFTFGEGIESVKDLITKWGGVVADKVSINTNYIVLGTAPKVPAKPTVEEIAADPRARERYEAAADKMQQYNDIISEAKTFSIPVFDQERFLDFIGYTK